MGLFCFFGGSPDTGVSNHIGHFEKKAFFNFFLICRLLIGGKLLRDP